jgi:hypothetical protein
MVKEVTQPKDDCAAFVTMSAKRASAPGVTLNLKMKGQYKAFRFPAQTRHTALSPEN